LRCNYGLAMKKKVILVQDNQDILEIMDEVLVEEGFDVTSSLTTDPLKKVDKIEPDLVIIDEHIKGTVKGSQVIKALKSDERTVDIPAVLTSTSNNLASLAEDCKADDFINKPFEIDEMLDTVKKNITTKKNT
jgi:two-component system response regulator VicR